MPGRRGRYFDWLAASAEARPARRSRPAACSRWGTAERRDAERELVQVRWSRRDQRQPGAASIEVLMTSVSAKPGSGGSPETVPGTAPGPGGRWRCAAKPPPAPGAGSLRSGGAGQQAAGRKASAGSRDAESPAAAVRPRRRRVLRPSTPRRRHQSVRRRRPAPAGSAVDEEAQPHAINPGLQGDGYFTCCGGGARYRRAPGCSVRGPCRSPGRPAGPRHRSTPGVPTMSDDSPPHS